MSKDVIVNGETYSGVSVVKLDTADGGTASFKETSEIQQGYTVDDIASLAISGDIVLGVSTVGDHAFYANNGITSVTSNTVTSIGKSGGISYCFCKCTSLKAVNMPNLEYICMGAFDACTTLESVSFPKVKSLGTGLTFNNCTTLTEAIIPNCTGHGQTAFKGCTNLKKIDTSGGFDSYGVLTGCTSLDTIIIRSSSVVKLNLNQGIQDTCFGQGKTGGTIYVPSALVESYKTADVWSTLYGYGTVTFAAIEGSEYE